MRDVGISPEDIAGTGQMRRTVGLALEAIERLIGMKKLGAACVLDDLVDQLAIAACQPDLAALPGAVAALRRAHVTDVSLVSDYIPEAARRLGEGWQNDSLSFVDVTMGTSRLADLLHEVGGDWKGDDAEVVGRPTVLLIVPPGEQHTLGAAVLACRMRLIGVSVCLRIAPALADLAGLIATRGFNGVMVTLANHEKAENCAVLVKSLRALGKGNLPVVLGGAAIHNEPDLKTMTGADLVTESLQEALALFGVEIKQKT